MTVDLLALLDEIARDAQDAVKKLALGESLSGSCALTRIQHKASDGARWAREDAGHDLSSPAVDALVRARALKVLARQDPAAYRELQRLGVVPETQR